MRHAYRDYLHALKRSVLDPGCLLQWNSKTITEKACISVTIRVWFAESRIYMSLRAYFIDKFFKVVVVVSGEEERAFRLAWAVKVHAIVGKCIILFHLYIQFILTFIRKVEKTYQKKILLIKCIICNNAIVVTYMVF